jgi:hypothetical protein
MGSMGERLEPPAVAVSCFGEAGEDTFGTLRPAVEETQGMRRETGEG